MRLAGEWRRYYHISRARLYGVDAYYYRARYISAYHLEMVSVPGDFLYFYGKLFLAYLPSSRQKVPITSPR